MSVHPFRSLTLPALAMLPGLLGGVAAAADEYAVFRNIPIVEARQGETNAATPAMALITLPSNWRAGGAAAVVVADRADTEAGLRDRLVAGLVTDGVAVLELMLPGDADRDLPVLFGALRELAREVGAARVVAVGTGQAAEVVLAAGAAGATVRHLGADGLRFAQVIDLRPGACRAALASLDPGATATVTASVACPGRPVPGPG